MDYTKMGGFHSPFNKQPRQFPKQPPIDRNMRGSQADKLFGRGNMGKQTDPNKADNPPQTQMDEILGRTNYSKQRPSSPNYSRGAIARRLGRGGAGSSV